MTIVSCTDFIVLAITCQAVRQVLCNIIQDTVEQLLFATNFQEVYQSPMIANMRIIFLAANWSLAYGCKNKTPVWLKLNREKIPASKFISGKPRYKVVANKSWYTVYDTLLCNDHDIYK